MVILALNTLISFIAWAGVSEHLQHLVAYSKRGVFVFDSSLSISNHVLHFASTPTWAIIIGLFLMLMEIFLGNERCRNQLAVLCVLQWIPLAYVLGAFLSGIVDSRIIYFG